MSHGNKTYLLHLTTEKENEMALQLAEMCMCGDKVTDKFTWISWKIKNRWYHYNGAAK